MSKTEMSERSIAWLKKTQIRRIKKSRQTQYELTELTKLTNCKPKPIGSTKLIYKNTIHLKLKQSELTNITHPKPYDSKLTNSKLRRRPFFKSLESELTNKYLTYYIILNPEMRTPKRTNANGHQYAMDACQVHSG